MPFLEIVDTVVEMRHVPLAPSICILEEHFLMAKMIATNACEPHDTDPRFVGARDPETMDKLEMAYSIRQ